METISLIVSALMTAQYFRHGNRSTKSRPRFSLWLLIIMTWYKFQNYSLSCEIIIWRKCSVMTNCSNYVLIHIDIFAFLIQSVHARCLTYRNSKWPVWQTQVKVSACCLDIFVNFPLTKRNLQTVVGWPAWEWSVTKAWPVQICFDSVYRHDQRQIVREY